LTGGRLNAVRDLGQIGGAIEPPRFSLFPEKAPSWRHRSARNPLKRADF
jgi:hypothetical protein